MAKRATLILVNDAVRERAAHWARTADVGTRVDFKGPKRTLDQNARFWAMLTDVASQVEHCGRSYTPDAWKVLFLHAIGREVQFLPALDGTTFIPFGQSSSDLSKAEMSDLMEFIASWGAERGVVFHDEQETAK